MEPVLPIVSGPVTREYTFWVVESDTVTAPEIGAAVSTVTIIVP
jgi:hypothetical protein